MTRKERLRRCYFNEELDRPAVYSRMGFPRDDPGYDRLKAYLLAHTEQKRHWGGGISSAPFHTESRTEPYSEDFSRRITTLHTPAGQFEATFLVSLKGLPGLSETYYLKSREDAERYLSLPLPQVTGDVSPFFRSVSEVGDTGIVDVGLGVNPGGAVAQLFGSTLFAMMSITDRDILHALCERQTTVILGRLKYLLAQGVGPYFSMAGQEFVAPPLHGLADFNDFNVSYDKRIIDLAHDSGGRVHVHCHGSMKTVLRSFIDMGADVLHPFESPPLGDITASEAKEIVRGRLCLEGNIQINRMYECTAEEIREETEALIRHAFDDRRGLIVSPTASPYIRGEGETCFPMYKAMVDTVVNWAG
jgi:hypothetical protein